MARVFAGVGSNIDRERNIRAGMEAMRRDFGELRVSPVYESRAVGFEGENFYNLVVEFRSALPPAAIAGRLHDIERDCGRARSPRKFEPRTLDLDLLLYDDVVCHDEGLSLPREDIMRFAFVLRPLSELAGNLRHPVSGRTFADLWSAFSDRGQELWPVNFDAVPVADH